MIAPDNVPLRAAKKALRAEVNAALLKMSRAKRHASSDRAWSELMQTKAWRDARCVMLYAPMPVELDLDRGWTNGALAGKEVGYPCIVDRTLEARVAGDLEQLRPGAFGLREPGPEAEKIRPEQLDLVIVPGLAFTPAGDRLGRGAGYYDRFLAVLPPRVATIALAFACQLRDRLPIEPHDQRVGRVIIG